MWIWLNKFFSKYCSIKLSTRFKDSINDSFTIRYTWPPLWSLKIHVLLQSMTHRPRLKVVFVEKISDVKKRIDQCSCFAANKNTSEGISCNSFSVHLLFILDWNYSWAQNFKMTCLNKKNLKISKNLSFRW